MDPQDLFLNGMICQVEELLEKMSENRTKINLLAIRLGHVVLRPHREGIALELWGPANDVHKGETLGHAIGAANLAM